MRLQLAPVTANSPNQLFASLTGALGRIAGRDGLVRAGFAYATLGGVQRFLSQVEEVSQWNSLPKEFLIGLHQAITEPSALELLRTAPNTLVRVFIPGKKLTLSAFSSSPVFHPKIVALCAADGRNVRLIQAGSTNLTSAAIGLVPHNFEFSVAVHADTPASIDPMRLFESWWSPLWTQSRVVDRGLILQYAALREQVMEKNPLLRCVVEVPASIETATYFFIGVGAGSGPPGFRHQVEFPESLVRFFGRVQRVRRPLTLYRGSEIWADRPLSYKRTTFGVEIWRLGMPTQATGGDPIANRAILFTRRPVRDAFDFEVVDLNTVSFRSWARKANISGHLGTTAGLRGRQYGFY
jgi:hypothetical protein